MVGAVARRWKSSGAEGGGAENVGDPFRGGHAACDEAEEGGFPRAVGAEEADDAAGEIDGDVAEGDDLPVPAGDVGELEDEAAHVRLSVVEILQRTMAMPAAKTPARMAAESHGL